MKKKQYMIPTIDVQVLEIQKMICGSVDGVGGDTGLTDPIPEVTPPDGGADARSLFDGWVDF